MKYGLIAIIGGLVAAACDNSGLELWPSMAFGLATGLTIHVFKGK